MSEPSISVTQAQPGEGAAVGRLVHALICELAPEGRPAPPLEEFEEVATRLLSDSSHYYWAFLARDARAEPIGVLTLNQCAATYARGRFGEIAELYVVPRGRSAEVGAGLLSAALTFARARGWHRSAGEREVRVPTARRPWISRRGVGRARTVPRAVTR